ncbi:hypothetical protein TNCV_3592841 [Trichonephila clavipes]|nr:hypothetical protein TNCV_3592841 [Trichonephila clavipes]
MFQQENALRPKPYIVLFEEHNYGFPLMPGPTKSPLVNLIEKIRSNSWDAQLTVPNDPRYARLETNLGIGKGRIEAFTTGSSHPNTIVITAEIEYGFVAKNDLVPFSCEDCGGPVVKVSDQGGHVISSNPVPLKSRRVIQRCTLNLSRAERPPVDVVVRRGKGGMPAQHHSKPRRRWVGVTRNGRRVPKCSSARRFWIFREDTGAPSKGATFAWMTTDEADGCTPVFLKVWEARQP